MYKILMVDDEESIREGLKLILDWDDFGIQVLEGASNGKEALEAIITEQPQIVITDIKMPLVDGIELIKQIRNQRLNTRIIVLSGFDDFLYVREAMKYGAENYLLKPVDREELSEAVKEIVRSLENDAAESENKKESLQILRDNTLNRIIKNEINIKQFNEKTEFLAIDFEYSLMQVAVIELCQHTEKDKYTELCRNICEESIGESLNGLIFPDDQNNIVSILRFRCVGNQSGHIRRILQECIERIVPAYATRVFAAVGGPVATYRDLNQSYKQALMCLDYKLILGSNTIVFFVDTGIDKAASSFPKPLNQDMVADFVKAGKKSELTDYFNCALSDLMNCGEGVSPKLIRDLSLQFVFCLANALREYKADPYSVIDLNEFTLQVMKIEDIGQLKDEMGGVIGKVVDFVTVLKNKKYTRIVGNAIEYIKDNYGSDEISLKTLSYGMNVNAAYLGRVFKEETGEFFSDYLCKFRLEKAKDLLINSSMKISDVSAKVGFPNTNYFYTIFKKYTGVNPGDLRKI